MCGWGSYSVNWPLVLWYLQGLLTPVIAVVALYIGWQQWRTAAAKTKLDLFDRRFQAIQEVRKVLERMFGARVTSDEVSAFWLATANAEFLFGEDVRKYRDEVFTHASYLSDIIVDLDKDNLKNISEEERKRLWDERQVHLRWTHEEVEKVADRFKSYLDLSKL